MYSRGVIFLLVSFGFVTILHTLCLLMIYIMMMNVSFLLYFSLKFCRTFKRFHTKFYGSFLLYLLTCVVSFLTSYTCLDLNNLSIFHT